MKEITVYNIKGKKVDTLKLNEKVFTQEINKTLLHQVVNVYLSNKRIGAASTKTRADVRGGGRKPWRQKGTGRARAGSIRSPIFRGGGVTFGPKPKDYSSSVSKKIKKKALLYSINSKLQTNDLIIIDKIEIDKPKTKEFVDIFKNLKLNMNKESKKENKLLVVVENFDENLKRSSRNIKNISVKCANNFNAYDVLAHDKLIVTKKSLESINKRVSL